MPLKSRFARSVVPRVAALAGRALRTTLDARAVHHDPTADPVHPRRAGPCVYLCWHEYLLLPVLEYGSQNVVALTSEHGDGQLLARAMRALGWDTVDGSSSRGGAAALLKLLRADRRHISITPDGPRGPRRTVAPGAVWLASKLRRPVVCVGYGYRSPWRAKSWDRFAVPRPFSRVRAVFGPAVQVPPDLSRDELEAYRGWFERLLHQLTDDAEWLANGTSWDGEVPMSPGHVPPAFRREPVPTAPPLPRELVEEWEALPNQRSVAGLCEAGAVRGR
jgi:lysophospholipid acyltransferase (LPLAT)-like uncharacterized protein